MFIFKEINLLMYRVVVILLTFFSWQLMSAQNLNDNCENAIDITQQIFHYVGFPESCNSIDGIPHNQHGLVIDSIENPTVDGPVYSSQGCIGYKTETTDHYPDLWYKSTFSEGDYLFAQSLFLYAGDTIQIAIYYGQCGALFQSKCFTLTFLDSIYWQGAWIEYYPHNVEDDIYIQLKVPQHYHDVIQICFSDDKWIPGSGLMYYFNYDTPADTLGTTGLNTIDKYSSIAIFPNPTNSWIKIRTEEEFINYSITDIHGKIWLTGNRKNSLEPIQLSDLAAGMYVIIVRTDKGIEVNKFIKL